MNKIFAAINAESSSIFKILYYLFLILYAFATVVIIAGGLVVKIHGFNVFFILGLLMMIGVGFLAYRMQIKHFWIWLLLVALIIRISLVFIAKVPVESDFLSQFSGAQFFAKNDFSFANWSYFQRWGYQAGLVVYEGVLLKIVNSVVFVQIMSAIVSALNALLVYLIAKLVFSNIRVAQVIGSFAALSFYQISMGLLLSNTTQAQFFLLLSLYLFLKYDRTNWKIGVLIGLLLVFAKIFRPDSLVFIVGYLVYYGFLLLKRNSWSFKFSVIKSLVSMMIVYLGIFALISFGFKQAKITNIGLTNANPEWGFVLGTNYQSHGQYANMYDKLTAKAKKENRSLRDVEREQIKINIKEITSTPLRPVKFFIDKESIYWFNGINNYYGVFYNHLASLYPSKLANRNYLTWMNGFDFGTQGIVNILGLLAIIPFLLIFAKQRNGQLFDQNIIFFLIFAFIAVAFLMEVQYKYSTHAQFLTLIASGYFLEYLTTKKNQASA